MLSLVHPHHPGCPPALHADLVELCERREADDEALRRREVVLDAVQVVRHHGQPRRVGRARLEWMVQEIASNISLQFGQKVV